MIVNEFVQRYMIKVPEDISREELQRLIRIQTGDENFVVTEELFKGFDETNKEKEAVRKLTEPFYNEFNQAETPANRAKKDELIDLARFLYHISTEHEVEIVACTEAPDFIIKFDGKVVGVEHTRLINTDIIADHKALLRLNA